VEESPESSNEEYGEDADQAEFEEALKLGNSMLPKRAEEPEASLPEPAIAPAKADVAPKEAPKAEVEDKLAPKFAALHKRATELEAKAAKIREQEAHFAKLQETLDNMKDEPAALLEAMGVDAREFFEKIAATGGKLTPEQKELRAIKKQLADKDAAEKAASEERAKGEQTAAQAAAVDNLNKDIIQFSKANTEKYGFLGVDGTHQLVFQQLQKHFDATKDELGRGEVLTLDQAAQAAQSELEGVFEKLASTEFGRKKIAELSAKSSQQSAASKPSTTTLVGPSGRTAAKAAVSPDEAEDEDFKAALGLLKQFEKKR